MSLRPAVIPCLRYEDAPAAILFLCDAFGFLPHAVYADDEDQQIVHHAQLLLDGNMVMLSSAQEGEVQARYGWKTPREAGGAEIITEPHDNEGYPGRGYTARDPEGNVWSFGSYDPFAPPPADA